jgi:enoyl-CoA hydratase/carnithine racemase
MLTSKFAGRLLRRSLSTPVAGKRKGRWIREEFEKEKILLAESYNGVQSLRSPGVRAVELNRPDLGNYLTVPVMDNLLKKMSDFRDNWVANAIFIGSQNIHFFSKGIHDDDAGMEVVNRVQSLAKNIYNFPEKSLLALYGGYITGTPFGMLLSSTVSPADIFPTLFLTNSSPFMHLL